ncbi:putative metal-dependent hydrolase domain protein, partial [Vibrio parahaemolyticus V-223/04]
GYLLSYMY